MMKKTGGRNMEAIAQKVTKEKRNVKSSTRYCTVHESLSESLKEVKLHREGKIKLDTWENFKNRE